MDIIGQCAGQRGSRFAQLIKMPRLIKDYIGKDRERQRETNASEVDFL